MANLEFNIGGRTVFLPKDQFVCGPVGRRGEEIYAPIIATDPTVFVPLQYAVNPDTDEQILFQDAACTVPVTAIGQPIGGVMWDGVIVAVQTTDARRPLWLGEETGAWFDGVDDELLTIGTTTNSAPHTVAACLKTDATESNFFWAYSASRSAMRTITSGANLNTRYIGATSGITLSATNVDQFGVLFGLYGSDGASEFGLRWRGEENYTDESATPDDQDGLYIGSRGGADFREMNCKWLAFHQRILTTDERITLEDVA